MGRREVEKVMCKPRKHTLAPRDTYAYRVAHTHPQCPLAAQKHSFQPLTLPEQKGRERATGDEVRTHTQQVSQTSWTDVRPAPWTSIQCHTEATHVVELI